MNLKDISAKCFVLSTIFSDQCQKALQELNDEDAEIKVIENYFSETCNMIEEKKGLSLFHREYFLLMNSFRKSYNTKQRLGSKVRQQAALIASNESKLKNNCELLECKPQLQREIVSNVVKMTKRLHEKEDEETTLLELKNKLELSIAALKERGSELERMNCGPTAYFKLHNRLENLREGLKTVIEDYKKTKEELERTRALVVDAEKEFEMIQNDKLEVLETIRTTVANTNELLKLKNDMEASLEAKRVNLETVNSQDENCRKIIEASENDILNLEKRKQNVLATIEDLRTKQQMIQDRFGDLEEELKSKLNSVQSLKTSNHAKKAESGVMQEEIKAVKSEIANTKKVNEALIKKNDHLAEKKLETDETRLEVQHEKNKLENEMARLKELHENERKQHEHLKKLNESIYRDLHLASITASKRAVVLDNCIKSQNNCKNIAIMYEEEAEAQQNEVKLLAADVQMCNNEIKETNDKIFEKESEIHCKTVELAKLTEQTHALQKKLKLQLNLLELMKQDASKTNCYLSEYQEELLNLKRELKLYQSQTVQLNQEIAFKNQTINLIIEERENVKRDLDFLLHNIELCNQEIKSNHLYIEAQATEEYKLLQMVCEADLEYQRKKKSVSKLISDRDILRWNLWYVNNEADRLIELLRSQSILVKRNEREYNMTMKVRNNIVANVYLNLSLTTEYKSHLWDLPMIERCCKNLESSLLQQNVLKSALQEECDRPINIHRWRRLKTNFYEDWRNMNFLPKETADDPYVYETLIRIHSITRRLIKRTADLAVCQKKTDELQKVYYDCKKIHARHPGLALCDQVHQFKAVLTAKRKEYNEMKMSLISQEDDIYLEKGRAKYIKEQFDNLTPQYFNFKREQLRRKLIYSVNISSKSSNTSTPIRPERHMSTCNLPQLEGISIKRS